MVGTRERRSRLVTALSLSLSLLSLALLSVGTVHPCDEPAGELSKLVAYVQIFEGRDAHTSKEPTPPDVHVSVDEREATRVVWPDQHLRLVSQAGERHDVDLLIAEPADLAAAVVPEFHASIAEPARRCVCVREENDELPQPRHAWWALLTQRLGHGEQPGGQYLPREEQLTSVRRDGAQLTITATTDPDETRLVRHEAIDKWPGVSQRYGDLRQRTDERIFGLLSTESEARENTHYNPRTKALAATPESSTLPRPSRATPKLPNSRPATT